MHTIKQLFSIFAPNLNKNTMKIKFLDAKQFEGTLKCTVQSNGKLNFSSSAIKAMALDNHKSVRFAYNQEGKSKDELYLLIQDKITDDAFKVNKAGNYYYLNAKSLFDNLGVDYVHHSVVFDLIKTNEVIDGLTLYKMNRRKGKVRKAR